MLLAFQESPSHQKSENRINGSGLAYNRRNNGGKVVKYKALLIISLIVLFGVISSIYAADEVPTDIQQPGTQPNEVGNLESPDKCDNCHGGYNSAVEPAFNWRGSMMANAGRDPIFWATLAIAEQDFDGAGDLCIRCHSTGGWYAGHSTPTDGSGLTVGDADGVDCDTCHKMTNPDNSEHLGMMNPPFLANDGGSPATGYYGSGMLSLWAGSDKLGPYNDADARHQFMQSEFHRDVDYCGSCHDVSNPAVGDLAHNNGAQPTANTVEASGVPGDPVDTKAAFNNEAFMYGIVERTFSEYKSGLLSQTLVSDYGNLPLALQDGAIKAAYLAAGGNYQDGTERYFSCQTCHMRAVTGEGANKKGVPIRTDLPLHDQTGGNYWMADAIIFQDSLGELRLGGGLTTTQIDALNAGKERAKQQLELAAKLEVTGDLVNPDDLSSGNTLKVINLTGHKLISGYPEGRRMWLNIKWYNADNKLLREDGAYGPMTVELDGLTYSVNSILDLQDPNTKIYEAHYAMTQDWGIQLANLGYPLELPLSYDRVSGEVDKTLNDLVSMPSNVDGETYLETFHFVLNNYVASDNRIPPYGFDYEEARKRNALPVPAEQYGYTAASGEYNYWDEFALNPPAGAAYATIDLLYQPTSWEYIQFLYLANDGQNAFLGSEGANMLVAWLNNEQAPPYVMASTTWGTPPASPQCIVPTGLSATPGNGEVVLEWTAVSGADGYNLYYDQSGKAQLITQITPASTITYTDNGLTNGQEYCYKVSSYQDATCESAYSEPLVCAIPNNQGQATDPAGVSSMETGIYSGKGNNKTYITQGSFTAGDGVVIRATVTDDAGQPVAGATVDLQITGPENLTLVTGTSDASGLAEVTWQTKAPGRGGNRGTTPGDYTVSASGLNATGYHWDRIVTNVTFTIQ